MKWWRDLQEEDRKGCPYAVAVTLLIIVMAVLLFSWVQEP